MVAEQLNKVLDQMKEFWGKLTEKTQKIVKISAAGVLVFAIGLTVLLYVPQMGYKIIFPGMNNSEATQVYATLVEMGVTPQIDKQGNVRVPSGQWDDLQYQLSAQGFPKTTLTYDIFSDMSGFTTTEFEKRVALTYQLQDRIQDTLQRWEGISDATVTITIPESSNIVWNQSTQEASTASVSIILRPGYSLSPEQVSAIKNHVASAVPKLAAQKVVVIDAATGVEPPSLESESSSTYSLKRLEFERQLEKAIEDNVMRLLIPSYGAGNVNAVAKVAVDYDKVVQEIKELTTDEDGKGVVDQIEEHYETGGGIPAEGIPGEENNTDIPQYPDLSGLDENDITVFDRFTDYEIGYILTQIEKGEPLLTDASIAVIVNDEFLNAEKEDLLVDLISKSVNIAPENIRVANLGLGGGTSDGGRFFWETMSWQTLLVMVGGGLAVLLIIIGLFMILARSRRRRRQLAAEAELAEMERQRQEELEREIADHKRLLKEGAVASSNPKENAITQEIRQFAEHNPEITANLIRSLMKEDR